VRRALGHDDGPARARSSSLDVLERCDPDRLLLRRDPTRVSSPVPTAVPKPAPRPVRLAPRLSIGVGPKLTPPRLSMLTLRPCSDLPLPGLRRSPSGILVTAAQLPTLALRTCPLRLRISIALDGTNSAAPTPAVVLALFSASAAHLSSISANTSCGVGGGEGCASCTPGAVECGRTRGRGSGRRKRRECVGRTTGTGCVCVRWEGGAYTLSVLSRFFAGRVWDSGWLRLLFRL
jgi:hypothetical protein